MTIADVFEKENLENSVLIGYYGGGNFGDELLLEILMNLFARQKVQALTVTYQHPERYATYHHEFGYNRIDMADKKAVLRAIMHNKNIVIGGGGLWGLDVNPNIFLLSSLLFVSRFLLRKRVYLLGVGYYSSTTPLGRLSAFMAGKAANIIIARDEETCTNFSKFQKNTHLDVDIAWASTQLSLDSSYDYDLQELEKKIITKKKTLFISMRRFRAGRNSGYEKQISDLIATHGEQPIIVALLEPAEVDPDGYRLLERWHKEHSNIQIMDFSYNPLALLLFFKKNHHMLAVIGPQFHLMIVAAIAKIPFLPIVYDNKVQHLVEYLGYEPIQIPALNLAILQQFLKQQGIINER